MYKLLFRESYIKMYLGQWWWAEALFERIVEDQNEKHIKRQLLKTNTLEEENFHWC